MKGPVELDNSIALRLDNSIAARQRARIALRLATLPSQTNDTALKREPARSPGGHSMSAANTLPAPDLSLAEVTPASWETERRAFLRLLPTLLTAHQGHYVAVHHGCVIAEGRDQVEVAKQAYALAGYVPIH